MISWNEFSIILVLISWASGALDPDNTSSGDLVTSVKRCAFLSVISLTLSYVIGIF